MLNGKNKLKNIDQYQIALSFIIYSNTIFIKLIIKKSRNFLNGNSYFYQFYKYIS
jgi:hypothetical protein